METPDARKARLAEALRANLRRRKAQVREAAAESLPPPSPPTSPRREDQDG